MAMKKLNYTVTVYKNTGFNGIDIPASGAVLENAQHNTYADTYYLREDYDLPQISINDNYHNLADVDYVRLVSNDAFSPNTFYYFATPHAAAGGTTTLSLELDALTTMGGAPNLNYISGWQERGHIAAADDELFANIAPEGWVPSETLVNTSYDVLNPSMSQFPLVTLNHPSNDLHIIISNIDLVKAGEHDYEMPVIKGMTVDETTGQLDEEAMYFPKIQTNESSKATVFRLYADATNIDTGFNSLTLPNTCAFDADNPKVKAGIDALMSCGQLQLQNSYTIPKEYLLASMVYGGVLQDNLIVYELDESQNQTGRFLKISGMISQDELSNIDFEYSDGGYTPKNKKCFSMFRNVSLSNIASGASITKPVYELRHYNSHTQQYDDNPIVRTWSDPVSTGKPYAKFISDVDVNILYTDTVNGSQWVNNQVLVEGASGSLWNAINASFAQQSINRENAVNAMNHNFAVQNFEIQQSNLEMQQGQQLLTNAGQIVGGVGAIAAGVAAAPATGGLSLAAAGAGVSMLATANQTSNLGTMQANQQAALNLQKSQEEQNFYKSQAANGQRINENKIGLLKANNVVAPTVLFNPDPNLAMYGMNKFISYETRLSHNDLESLDNYFQRYGYNGIHRPLTANCFNCRTYYCYVQAFDVNIKATGSYGMRIRNKAISQLNGGVRVWKVLPDSQYYEQN